MRHSSGDCFPRLATPSLAGAAGEVVDSSSLRFLAVQAVLAKEKELDEEEEERS